MKILVIEDDEQVGAFLKENLTKENYSVEIISTFKETELFIQNQPYSPLLFIVDRLLGNDDTKSLIRKIKQQFQESMILILSALNSPAEKAELLDNGADDYMGKPFSLVELQARVRALIRRNTQLSTRGSQGFYITVGDLTIDLKSRTVLCNDKKIEFTPKEFSLTVNFCENVNRVYSKYQLLDIIWETNLDVESNVIEVNIMNIRKKLEYCNSRLKIQSKRNVGYWLET